MLSLDSALSAKFNYHRRNGCFAAFTFPLKATEIKNKNKIISQPLCQCCAVLVCTSGEEKDSSEDIFLLSCMCVHVVSDYENISYPL